MRTLRMMQSAETVLALFACCLSSWILRGKSAQRRSIKFRFAQTRTRQTGRSTSLLRLDVATFTVFPIVIRFAPRAKLARSLRFAAATDCTLHRRNRRAVDDDDHGIISRVRSHDRWTTSLDHRSPTSRSFPSARVMSSSRRDLFIPGRRIAIAQTHARWPCN